MFEFWGGGGGLYNVADPTPTTTTKFDKENVPSSKIMFEFSGGGGGGGMMCHTSPYHHLQGWKEEFSKF